jgi:thymidylate synthase (FAD)
MKAEVVALTAPMGRMAVFCKTAEDLMIAIARVSNPANQENVETGPKLLRYCLREEHWSIFESICLTVEVTTSRAIAAQILRHRSFTFQEFSQRYAVAVSGHEPLELRLAGATNRQGSLSTADEELHKLAEEAMANSESAYKKLIDSGVAPETARFVLPLGTSTSLFMTGNIRSWIFYLKQRTSSHAQKEHRLLATSIQELLVPLFPNLSEALGWNS